MGVKTDSRTAASLRGSAAFELGGCDQEAAELPGVVEDRRGQMSEGRRPLLNNPARLRWNREHRAIRESAQMLLQVLTLKGNSLFPFGAFFPAPGSFIWWNVLMIFGFIPIPPGVSKGRTTNMGNI